MSDVRNESCYNVVCKVLSLYLYYSVTVFEYVTREEENICKQHTLLQIFCGHFIPYRPYCFCSLLMHHHRSWNLSTSFANLSELQILENKCHFYYVCMSINQCTSLVGILNHHVSNKFPVISDWLIINKNIIIWAHACIHIYRKVSDFYPHFYCIE